MAERYFTVTVFELDELDKDALTDWLQAEGLYYETKETY